MKNLTASCVANANIIHSKSLSSFTCSVTTGSSTTFSSIGSPFTKLFLGPIGFQLYLLQQVAVELVGVVKKPLVGLP